MPKHEGISKLVCDLIQEEEGKEESFESEIKKWDWGGGVSTE